MRWLRFLNTRRADSGVSAPVMLGVARTPVVRNVRGAGCGMEARCAEGSLWAACFPIRVVQMNARCAVRDSRCA